MDEKAERRAIVEEAVREEQQFREMKKQHLAAEASRVRDVREEEKLEEVKRAEMRAMMDDLHAYEQKFDGRQSATDGASGDDDGGDGDDGDPLRATLPATAVRRSSGRSGRSCPSTRSAKRPTMSGINGSASRRARGASSS